MLWARGLLLSSTKDVRRQIPFLAELRVTISGFVQRDRPLRLTILSHQLELELNPLKGNESYTTTKTIKGIEDRKIAKRTEENKDQQVEN